MADEKQDGLLRDMLDSGRQIRTYLGGLTHDGFLADNLVQDAVLRRFEIVGEVASRISPETQAHFPSLPFRSMRGMRNIIAHDYGEVDLEQVWKTATVDLPTMIAALEAYFA
jgi:uncharacterized protein with HEPN domain